MNRFGQITSLKQLVDMQSFNNKTDGEIICDWFSINGLEVEGIEMISKIAKKKMEDDEWNLQKIRGNMTNPTGFYYSTYPKDIAIKFDYLTRCMQLGYDLNEPFFEKDIEWAKEIIPTLKKPTLFWRELWDFFNEKGIYFKGEDKGE